MTYVRCRRRRHRTRGCASSLNCIFPERWRRCAGADAISSIYWYVSVCVVCAPYTQSVTRLALSSSIDRRRPRERVMVGKRIIASQCTRARTHTHTHKHTRECRDIRTRECRERHTKKPCEWPPARNALRIDGCVGVCIALPQRHYIRTHSRSVYGARCLVSEIEYEWSRAQIYEWTCVHIGWRMHAFTHSHTPPIPWMNIRFAYKNARPWSLQVHRKMFAVVRCGAAHFRTRSVVHVLAAIGWATDTNLVYAWFRKYMHTNKHTHTNAYNGMWMNERTTRAVDRTAAFLANALRHFPSTPIRPSR